MKKEDFKSMKKKLIADVSHSSKANFWGFVIAIFCMVCAVVVPLTITNNEVKAAKEEAARAAQEAFEQAKQAALEAEKKAEEERMIAMNQALAEQKAAEAAAEAERLAAEKAAKEREELISQIHASVEGIVNNQMEEDFNTQYEIQKSIMGRQTESESLYENYLNTSLSRVDEAFINVDRAFENVEQDIDSIRNDIYLIRDDIYAINQREVEAAIEAESDHYSRNKRIDASVYAFGFGKTTKGLAGLDAKFIRSLNDTFGLGGTFQVDNSRLAAFITGEFMPVNTMKLNLGLDLGVGGQLLFSGSKFCLSMYAGADVRYTASEGYELLFSPKAVLYTDFNSFDYLLLPVSVGVSFTFR